MYNRREIGSHYEDIAAEYLEKQGYVILQRNYRAGRHGELDIIAEDPAGLLVICECRYRRKTGYGDPLESVNMAKQRQICRTTLYYYKEHGYGIDHACRFDVIAVSGDGSLSHIKNAFEFI